MPKILYLITGLTYGGAERQLVYLSTAMQAAGWEVSVVSMLPLQGLAVELEKSGVSLYTLQMRRGKPSIKALQKFIRIVQDNQPHIVHTHMVHANLMGRVTRLFTPIPFLICTVQNINEGKRYREIAYRLTDPLCDLTTQVSLAGLNRYVSIKAVPSHKIAFIPNGIDTDKFAFSQEKRAILRNALQLNETFTWLAVGRFDPAKDYHTMLKAFANVISERAAVLMIAGEGPEQSQIKQLASDLGIEQFVKFLGLRKDVPDLMSAADAFILSSAWEGLPLVLLEASASELPIVATDVGGNREVVLNEQTGILVPPANPDMLGRAMSRLMQLTDIERRSMGKQARKHVEDNYSLKYVMSLWANLYNKALDQIKLKPRYAKSK
ncbi:MAG: glycosyltransferase [Candidatus Bathyarchaeia archaeon]